MKNAVDLSGCLKNKKPCDLTYISRVDISLKFHGELIERRELRLRCHIFYHSLQDSVDLFE